MEIIGHANIDGQDYEIIAEHFTNGEHWFATTSGTVVADRDSEIFWYC